MIRALIVDDEVPARAKLRLLLSAQDELEIVGERADGPSAAQAIVTLSPDVVFLDVQMPGMSGLDVAAQLETASAPCIVFVTAFDVHAVSAFDLGAVDYILKPYDEERFRRAMERVRERLLLPPAGRAGAVTLARAQLGPAERLLVPSGDELRLIDSATIESLEADGNYVHVQTSGGAYLLRRTLQDLLRQLGDGRFIRIHKSAAVNINDIEALSPLFKGDYELRLRSGRTFRLSRRFAAGLFARTGR